jgi:hypothetical protein
MALTVEDGTGLAAADSYISEANADAYAVARYGATDPFAVLTTAQQEEKLRLAAQELDGEYLERLKGVRKTQLQGLAWPRKNVRDLDDYAVDADSVPVVVQEAQVEYARRITDGTDIHPDQERGGRVKREKIDVIDITYMDGAPASTIFDQVDRMMRSLLTGGRSEFRMERG